MKDADTAYRRLNITLPRETVRLVDLVAGRGDRSRFIADAIAFYVGAPPRAELKSRLKKGAQRRADRDRALAIEWFDLDDEDGRRTEDSTSTAWRDPRRPL
jgi:CopG family transcriptional regulator / antitoxin EndoAI